MVGIDRLLAAVAANRLRNPKRPAVIVDLGTAITVDLVDAEGVFRGGAILPGIAISARAMHDYTDLLPHIPMAELEEPPPALGRATVPAMRSGLYWGAVGAVRELIERLAEQDRRPARRVPHRRRRPGGGGTDQAHAPLRTAPDACRNRHHGGRIARSH